MSMNARSVFACAAAGIALMTLGATNAAADDLSVETLEVTPGVVGAGDTVTLSGTCDYPGFTVPAPTESGALVPTTLTGTKDASGVWHVTGTTTVRQGVVPGGWSVLFECAPGDVAVANFTVVAETRPAPLPTPRSTPQPAAKPVQQVAEELPKAEVPVTPKERARTAASEEPTDSTALLVGVGAAALLAAGGLGVWGYRKRTR
jgi:hypothetical protein